MSKSKDPSTEVLKMTIPWSRQLVNILGAAKIISNTGNKNPPNDLHFMISPQHA